MGDCCGVIPSLGEIATNRGWFDTELVASNYVYNKDNYSEERKVSSWTVIKRLVFMILWCDVRTMKAKAVPLHGIQTLKGVGLWLYPYLTTPLEEGELWAPRLNRFNRWKENHYPFNKSLGAGLEG
jgi:hypothetical protein